MLELPSKDVCLSRVDKTVYKFTSTSIYIIVAMAIKPNHPC